MYDLAMTKLSYYRNVVTQISYLIVCCTKYGSPLLRDPEHSIFLSTQLQELCAQHGYELQSFQVHNSYVIMHLQLSPNEAIGNAMRTIKGTLGRKMLKQFPDLRLEMVDGNFWAPTYFVATEGEVSTETIQDFIAFASQTKKRR